VTYSVWQGDCLIGETDLANERVDARYRSGNFLPSPGSEALIPTTDLSLQLRDANGRVIPTDWVAVYDLDARPTDDEEDLDFDDSFDEPFGDDLALIREWIGAKERPGETDDELFGEEFSRYQIQLKLAEDAAIP
jgi:hypothetical protein